jgi:hypothetical protein
MTARVIPFPAALASEPRTASAPPATLFLVSPARVNAWAARCYWAGAWDALALVPVGFAAGVLVAWGIG